MSAEQLFEVPAAPLRYMPEVGMVNLLIKRHTRISMGAHRYAYADHVPNTCWGASRIADFIAVDCYGNYGERPNPIHGFEIKSSRGDWLAELRDPTKADAFKPYVDYWWLVVSDKRIVKDGELPGDWGLLAVMGDRLCSVKRAPRLNPEPMPRRMVAALTRAVARTARNAL